MKTSEAYKILKNYGTNEEIVNFIFDNKNVTIEKEFFKNVLLTENDWESFIKKYVRELNWKFVSKNPNITMSMIENNLNLPWKWGDIGANPNLTIGFIKRFPDEPWRFDLISRNPAITMEDVKNNPDLPWDFGGLSMNPNLTIEYVKNNLDKNWNWADITFNADVNDIKNNPDLPWAWYAFGSNNKNITIDFITKHMEKGNIMDLFKVSLNPEIKPDDVRNNPDLPWEFYLGGFSYNPSIDIEFVKEFKDRLCFQEVSANPGITMEDIRNNPDLPWEWLDVSINPNLTIDFVKEIMNKVTKKATDDIAEEVAEAQRAVIEGAQDQYIRNTTEASIIAQEMITEAVNDAIENEMDWNEISKNVGITMEDIKNNPDLPWKYPSVSRNPNLTFEFIEEFPNKPWRIDLMSKNPMEMHPRIQEKRRQGFKEYTKGKLILLNKTRLNQDVIDKISGYLGDF